MPEPPAGAPPFKGHRAAYRELLESLWYASETFEKEGDGGLEGAKLACRAVGRFIAVTHENPRLAAPFLTIMQSFNDLAQGLDPPLFSTNLKPRERERSSQRKHLQDDSSSRNGGADGAGTQPGRHCAAGGCCRSKVARVPRADHYIHNNSQLARPSSLTQLMGAIPSSSSCGIIFLGSSAQSRT
jgi:hypothetical protein